MAAASRFAKRSDKEISEMKIEAIPKITQSATSYCVNLFNGMAAFSFVLKYFLNDFS